MAQISQKALMALLFVGVLMGALDLVIIGPAAASPLPSPQRLGNSGLTWVPH